MSIADERLTEEERKMVHALEELISRAVKKLGAKKENDICRYLPITTGGYMHHFTMRKMKTENPRSLSEMIQKYIISADKPLSVIPKPRAARGSRKRKDALALSRMQVERLLEYAKKLGDNDIIDKLSPKRSLAAYRRELIAAVKRDEVSERHWRDYTEALQVVKNEYSNAETFTSPTSPTSGPSIASSINNPNW